MQKMISIAIANSDIYFPNYIFVYISITLIQSYNNPTTMENISMLIQCSIANLIISN